jgi:CheY-like chemotaxis protein
MNGQEGDALKENEVDLILMDLQMPMDGYRGYDSNCNGLAGTQYSTVNYSSYC